MKNSVKAAIALVLKTALELNGPGFHVFFSYSGHVDNYDIRVYPNGWSGVDDPPPLRVYLWQNQSVTNDSNGIRLCQKTVRGLRELYSKHHAKGAAE